MSRDPNTARPNHLSGETSPYLLQHLYNPVDWYPWGEEALERSAREDKPIFLSIGYSACHWCHVMEHESFENDETAAFLNEHFVSIKVDREERPDLDEIYMNAVQLMTRSGGWPLNVFLTPERNPFFGGTYFPPDSRYGRIAFPDLLRRIHEAWTTRRDELERSAAEMLEQLTLIAVADPGRIAEGDSPGRAETIRAVAELTGRHDAIRGGFGTAPKFPPDGAIGLLLREHARTGEAAPLEMAERTLQAMARGGIYDHVGGGFARYSVDDVWLVPHFEKMLYNQALLAPLYADAWRITGQPIYRRVVEETLDFVLRELRDAGGGFHSSLDADSEGREGAFYVWTPARIEEVLGPENAATFCEFFDITPDGNFEGFGIPNLLGSSLAERAVASGVTEEALVERLSPMLGRLLEARERRPRPATDDKVLTAWNGLMITAFSRAYQTFERPQDLTAAREAAGFALRELVRDGRLLVTHRDGHSKLNAYLDEHAFLGRGLLDLYESDFDRSWIEAAEGIARTLIEHFEDRDRGGFFFTSDDHEALPTRGRSLHDGALPAGAGVATELLLRLALHLDDESLRRPAMRALEAYAPLVRRSPSAHAALLVAADLAEGPVLEVAVVGDADDVATRCLLREVRRRYLPRLAVVSAAPGASDERLALLRGRTGAAENPVAFVCRDYSCERPTGDAEELGRQLEAGGAKVSR